MYVALEWRAQAKRFITLENKVGLVLESALLLVHKKKKIEIELE